MVKGGPGTGKTVIALHLLALIAGMKGRSLNVHYATKSKPLLEGVKHQLPRGSKAKMLFHNVTQYVPANCNENEIDVLMVDEAHRMTNSSNNQYTPAEKRTDMPQVETLIRASKVAVFFIDDKQAIRGVEIGSSNLIREYAKKYNAKIEEVQLKSQFRCNGSDGYLAWLDDVLEIRETANYNLEGLDFDFQVLDKPEQVRDIIFKKNKINNRSRILAGYCWDWNKKGENDTNVHDIKIGPFAMSWNLKSSTTYAIDPGSVNEVGCIHTSQGLEFEYVGVIIGKDLRYENGKIVTDFTQRARTDTSLKGIKSIYKR